MSEYTCLSELSHNMCEEKQFMHNIPSYLVAQGGPSSHPSLKNPEEANAHCPCTLTIHCTLIIEQFRRNTEVLLLCRVAVND